MVFVGALKCIVQKFVVHIGVNTKPQKYKYTMKYMTGVRGEHKTMTGGRSNKKFGCESYSQK